MFVKLVVALLFGGIWSASALPHSQGVKGDEHVLAPIYSCGGVGNVVDMRILGCNDCTLLPGQRYDIEVDFYPSEAAQKLYVRASVCMEIGYCTIVLDVELLNSALYPDVLKTTRYNLVPGERAKEHRISYYIKTPSGDVIQACAAMSIHQSS